MKTPLVTNAASKKKYPSTPFPEAEIRASSEDASQATKTSTSPSNSSVSSFKSGSFRRKASPKNKKSVPKSALKTRKGFVRERVTELHQNIDTTSAVTDV